ncbi:uncharacterized protein MYCFIDRAFT_178626 [Pseudocercospora fijiensis CIRAD86]|uniref:Uncharacterized protein n=1 Tax=Pseudocercospora fijiensis (strain CIRAD86) TaxID=383855 RepID=M3AMX4_PSEFD|nr:uncharacterized protein MYCFIDRAFT_178626 [Pseudocercospora fijiensis CIRAD86]EME78483.1 hypothetical protein MYCFIDRAFT_178626 [Pseudocercospora fijiensis CIRAD86]
MWDADGGEEVMWLCLALALSLIDSRCRPYVMRASRRVRRLAHSRSRPDVLWLVVPSDAAVARATAASNSSAPPPNKATTHRRLIIAIATALANDAGHWMCLSRILSCSGRSAGSGSDEVLCSDAEDDWALAERAAKRRRVERLAHHFLDGLGLEVTSARLDPRSFRQACTYSFATPNDAHIALAGADSDPAGHSDEDWPDLWEVLRATNRHGEPIAPHAGIVDMAHDATAAEAHAHAHAQSTCQRRSSRRRRLVRIALDPSEDALRRAAGLRARNWPPSLPEIAESQPPSAPVTLADETQSAPLSPPSTAQDTTSFSDHRPSPTPAWTSSKWLRTRAFQPPKKRVDEDCSKDELALSSFSLASQHARPRPRALQRRPAERDASSPPSFIAGLSGQPSTATRSFLTAPPHPTGQDLSAIPEADTGPTECGGHFETAPGEAEGHANPVSEARESQLQGESQTQLFICEGILAKPRMSWASVDDAKLVREAQCTAEQSLAPIASEHVPSIIRESGQNSVQSKAMKKTKGRSTTSAGNTSPAIDNQPRRRSNRRRSAPSQSQKAAEEIDELPAEQRRGITVQRVEYTETAGGKNSSPFVFRKRATRSAKADMTEQEATLLPSEHTRLPSVTPRRAMQFPSDDSQDVNQDPYTPLVNEHLNTVLPKDTTTARRSTLRSSLRNEMQALGAEISRAANDSSSQSEPGSQRHELPPADVENEENVPSQQYDAQADEGQNDESSHPLQIPIAELPSALPGTQAMLDQAHHDLFTSPNKTNSDLYLGENSTPGALPNVGKSARRPLGALSQERMPIPSTQALINEWHGWSSVKKPREPGKRSSLEAFQSPTVTKGKARDSAKIASDPFESLGKDARRRSSLRFSMSFADSAAKEPAKKPSSQPAPSTVLVPETSDKHECLAFTAPKPSGKIASSATFSFAAEMSSIHLPSASSAPAQSFAASTRSQHSVAHGIDSLSFGPHEHEPPPYLNAPDDRPPDISLAKHAGTSKQHVQSSKSVVSDCQTSCYDQNIDEDEHDLSFAAPLPQVPHPVVPTQDETLLEQDATTIDSDAPAPSYVRNNAPTPSYIRNNAPTPSHIGRQNSAVLSAPAPSPKDLEYDSQELAGAVNELTRDVLGSVRKETGGEG